MASLYANENFPLQVVRLLREMGHDVVTTQDIGMSGQAIPDQQVLDYAIANQRILLTLNRKDFIALHRKITDHSGIIICTQDIDWTGQAQRIHQKILETTNFTGQLLRVNRPLK